MKTMDTEGSSSRSSKVTESDLGIPQFIIDFMVYTAQRTDITATDFYLQLKQFLSRTPESHILSVFNQIREKFPVNLETSEKIRGKSTIPELTRIQVDTGLRDFFLEKMKQLGGIQEQQDWVDDIVRDYCFGAIDENMKRTEFGEKLDAFNLTPVLSRILMAGVDFGCGHEVLTIVAMIAVKGNYFQVTKSKERRVQVAQKKAAYFHEHGDLLTLLAIYEEGDEHGLSRSWCSDNLLSFQALQDAKVKRDEIAGAMNRMLLKIDGGDQTNPMIRKAITAGMFCQSAAWDPRAGCYRTLLKNRPVYIHGGGALFHKEKPAFVVYSGIVHGKENEECITEVTAIDPKWLVELAPLLYRDVGPTA